jgi:G3E family GTPase
VRYARGVSVPLVIVTGFLGAGKTTLINRLLARRAQRNASGKLGLVVNELGEVGIDGALLGGQTARQIELPGGCVCCVLGDDLGAALIELIDRNPELEAIVLETTGVAEPLAISWAVAREPVASRVRLAAVVTLLDATHFLASRSMSSSVDAQVAYADVLLLTKAEVAVSSDDIERVEAVAHMLAPRALVRRGSADDHAAWLEALLADPELPSRSADDATRPAAAGQPFAQPNGQVTEHVHTDDCRHLDSPAAHGIDSVWVAVDRPLDLEELEDQLAELPPNYVRIKGIVRAARDGEEGWIAVHRVGPRVSSERIEPAEHQQGRIVALGPSVSRAELARCVAVAAT